MLKKERQQIYFTSAAASAMKHLDAFNRNRKVEELHRFRVEVKRLRALLLLFKGHPDSGKLQKSFQPVHIIYKKAGAIRLLDVHKEMISGLHYIQPSLLLKLAQLRDKKATKFISAGKSDQLKFEASILKISQQLFDVESRFIIKKCRKHLKKISDALSKNKNDIEALHKARKRIKMLTYTDSIFPKSITSEIQLNKKYLNKLEHMIGDWHDIAQTTELLTASGVTNPQAFQKLKLQEKTAQQRFGKLAQGFSKKVKE